MDAEHIPMNRLQLETIFSITRYALLCSTAIIAKSIDLSYYAVFLAFNQDNQLRHSVYHLINKWLFFPVLIIEIVCILLTFGFNSERYEARCMPLHNLCEKTCTHFAEQKIRIHLQERAKSFSGSYASSNDVNLWNHRDIVQYAPNFLILIISIFVLYIVIISHFQSWNEWNYANPRSWFRENEM